MAPNNRIYLSAASGLTQPYGYNYYTPYNQKLWMINSPDSAGIACNLQPLAYYLGDSARSYYSLPNMPNYNLTALSIYQSDAGRDTFICSSNTQGIMIGTPTVSGVQYSWLGPNISNPALAQPTVRPTQSGWYYLTTTDTSIRYSCQSRTDSVYIQVRSCCDSALLLQATAGRDTSFCGDNPIIGSVPIGGTAVPGVTYTWQAGQGISNVHNSSQLVHPSNSTWYYATFSDSNNPSCPSRVDSVHVVVLSCCDSILLLQATAGRDTFFCGDNPSIISVPIGETAVAGITDSVYVQVRACCDTTLLSLATAGHDTSFCREDTTVTGITIGAPTVTGITYMWQQGPGINDIHSSIQQVYPDGSRWYYVTFSDSSGNGCPTKTDSVYIEVKRCCDTSLLALVSAGRDTTYCNDSIRGVAIGSPSITGISYHWYPTTGLSDANAAQPTAMPSMDTHYILSATDTSRPNVVCITRIDTVFVWVQKCDTTSINEVFLQRVKVYPNPASNELIIETTQADSTLFKLYDIVGHAVVEINLTDTKTKVNISHLPQGIYFYRTGNLSGKVQVVR